MRRRVAIRWTVECIWQPNGLHEQGMDQRDDRALDATYANDERWMYGSVTLEGSALILRRHGARCADNGVLLPRVGTVDSESSVYNREQWQDVK